MGLGSTGPRQPAAHLVQVAVLAAAATLLLTLLRQGGALFHSSDGALLLKIARKHINDATTVTGGRTAHRHVAAATCPSTEQVAASHWAHDCHHVRRACVDQGVLVLFDERYQPKYAGGTGGEDPPSFSADGGFGQFTHTYRNGIRQRKYPLTTIRSRPAAQDEGGPALHNPRFSNCTVPVVWFPFWLTNFGHLLRDNGAKLWGGVQDTPWGAAIKLVPVTAEGQSLPAMVQQLLQPITPLRVESWADFATRLAPGADQLVLPGPPPSAEGSHQRCFENMLICTHGLESTRLPLHAYGQRIAEAYRHLLSPEVAQAMATQSSIRSHKAGGSGGSNDSSSHGSGDGSSINASSSNGSGSSDGKGSSGGSSSSNGSSSSISSSGSSSNAGGTTVLNVVFQRRNATTRQLLNAAELVQRCNGWRHTTAEGRQLAAKCWQADITDLASGLTAARQADVMVGIHGANLANGWMMRPGSSMIEVQAFGFDQHPPHLQDPLINAKDSESQVLWWVLQGCDPGAWQPSPQEAADKGDPGAWPKNRSMLLRWEALDAALRQVAETGGDMQRYWQLWRTGQWWWHVRADGIEYGGDRKNICSAAQEVLGERSAR